VSSQPDGAVLGLFSTPEGAARAVEGLRAAGFERTRFEILSDAPYPEGAFGEAPEPHRLYTFTLVGALAGLAVGVLVTIGTQLSYPVVTGGKPILSIPPMINVIFEGTMLGAIVLTFVGVLFESRLPSFGGLYDPRISDGCLGVLVQASPGQQSAATSALRAAGAIDIVGADRAGTGR
jgi:hypothetical protein